MVSLTIRGLDDSLKSKLRIRAADHNRSMEAETREILTCGLADGKRGELNFSDSIRHRFEPLGPFKLELPPREPTREPPDLEVLSPTGLTQVSQREMTVI